MVSDEQITTIKLSKNTKARLEKLKLHKKESHEDSIKRILGILNTLKENPFNAKVRLTEIEKTRAKISKTLGKK